MSVRRRAVVCMVYICLGASLFSGAAGCGAVLSKQTTASGRTDPSAETSVEGPRSSAVTSLPVTLESGTAVTSTSATVAESSVLDLFVGLAEDLAPVPAYGVSELPEGAEVAATWWPVVDCGGPDEYEGPARPNPWVNQDPLEPEAQLVLDLSGGWLVVLENFRGDLGDVSGRAVGSVDESGATLYEVNEGHLVQWSHAGRWYGVFGRGVPSDLVVDLALQMRLIPE